MSNILKHYFSTDDRASCNYRWCELCSKRINESDDNFCIRGEQDVMIVKGEDIAEHVLNHGYCIEGMTKRSDVPHTGVYGQTTSVSHYPATYVLRKCSF